MFPSGTGSVGTLMYNLVKGGWALWLAWYPPSGGGKHGSSLTPVMPAEGSCGSLQKRRGAETTHPSLSSLPLSLSLSRLFLQPKKMGHTAFRHSRKISHMLHPAPFPFHSLKAELFINLRLLEESDSQQWKVGWWMPEGERMTQSCFVASEFQFWKMKFWSWSW